MLPPVLLVKLRPLALLSFSRSDSRCPSVALSIVAALWLPGAFCLICVPPPPPPPPCSCIMISSMVSPPTTFHETDHILPARHYRRSRRIHVPVFCLVPEKQRSAPMHPPCSETEARAFSYSPCSPAALCHRHAEQDPVLRVNQQLRCHRPILHRHP